MQNSPDNVFKNVPVDECEPKRLTSFLNSHDFSSSTRRAIASDLRKFGMWFHDSNGEKLQMTRVTLRDVVDFREHLSRIKKQSVASINRCLVTLRRYMGWLADQSILESNPAVQVKELRQQQQAPKGLDRQKVRRLLRELEIRQDVRTLAIVSLMLHTGCRVGDVVSLDLDDLIIGERKGSATFRNGKGGKLRRVPLPHPARIALKEYLLQRPPVSSRKTFMGNRGALTADGVRLLLDKYSSTVETKLHPHLLRHTFAHQFLNDNSNDLVALAQILGHENLNTTARYTQRTEDALAEASAKVTY